MSSREPQNTYDALLIFHDELPDFDQKFFPLRVFERFPEWPKELRLKIWRHTLPSKRFISLKNLAPWQPVELARMFCDTKQIIPSNPVALMVNHQSREEVLRSHVFLFTNRLGYYRLYFNPTRDVIRVEDIWSFRPAYTGNIRRYQDLIPAPNFLWTLDQSISWFASVEHLTLIPDPNEEKLSPNTTEVCHQKLTQLFLDAGLKIPEIVIKRFALKGLQGDDGQPSTSHTKEPNNANIINNDTENSEDMESSQDAQNSENTDMSESAGTL
ncbi:hypothetical protein G7Y89_g9032 [Cudoniella acicularis]|uniref:2EXR domain-containing protein n=1 Tax=Cudoniella acicularis TaxID=354080 RepID=A0A8H4W0I0_9HELO|nr:hypothetical protein G7Y89_g9032 [Cudoniella acicularis]